ncbi:MerR family transcriptional regulator [Pediococcus claussenii]|nr:MerR family transcriptional regulator [Pediococcus claussenii]ANZ69708.1 MerR family transcriptional regulator [Pediococcus claussenii]ANZ71525.1 MerR family transcriptional regulator [Pediococcus claussenii]
MAKTYSVKRVAEIFGLSVSALHFYDKKGLLPFVSKNEMGYRIFTDSDLNFIHTICCLKDTGMKIDNIRSYIEFCMEGPTTINKRRQLLEEHRRKIEEQQRVLAERKQEVDEKLSIYRSKDAAEIINHEINYVSAEKSSVNLKNPFAKLQNGRQ